MASLALCLYDMIVLSYTSILIHHIFIDTALSKPTGKTRLNGTYKTFTIFVSHKFNYQSYRDVSKRNFNLMNILNYLTRLCENIKVCHANIRSVYYKLLSPRSTLSKKIFCDGEKIISSHGLVFLKYIFVENCTKL